MLLHQHYLYSRPKLNHQWRHWHRSCCGSFWTEQKRQTWHLRRALMGCRVIMGSADHESAIPGLLGTCALMFFGAYGCGMLPSWVSISEQRLSNVNAVGAGLLLGSALCVILPEGFEAAMELHQESGLPKWSLALTLLAGFWFMLVLDTMSHWLPGSSGGSSGSSRVVAKASRSSSGQEQVILEHPTAAAECTDHEVDSELEQHVVLLADLTGRGMRAVGSSTGTSQPSTPRAQGAAREDRAAAAAEMPLSGRPSFSSGSSSLRPPQQSAAGASGAAAGAMRPGLGAVGSAAMSRLSGSIRSSLAQGQGAESGGGAARDPSWWHWTSWLKDPSQQALLGLLVHAASDGLAVGAASLSEEPAVGLGVALAMVVHKGPVAMGLGAFLRAAAWAPVAVHRGVLLFSLASPVAALLTYLVLSVLPVLSGDGKIPLAVLFSGGTVLYAATMHILPTALDSQQHHMHSHAHASSYAGSAVKTTTSSSRISKGQQQHGTSKLQLLLVSLGMVLPLLLMVVLQVEHEH